MEERELIKKLNNLKSVKPDDNWKKSYRDILYSQISAGSMANQSKSNLKIIWENIMAWEVLADLAKPVWVSSLAGILIMVIVIGGVYASKNTKPGDSLYIAKIISEKAQQAITFDEKDKAKLNLEFAANRAKEITQVLKDSNQTNSLSQEKVETLSKDFKKEISQAKDRLTTIKAAGKQAKDDEQVFGANLEKSNQRMEIAEPAKTEAKQEANSAVQIVNNQLETNATTTVQTSNQTDKLLEEAEKMFDEKNYDGTINKLEEVNKVINQAAKDDAGGQVKGESETASSTK